MERISEYFMSQQNMQILCTFYQHRVKVCHICFLCLSDCALQQSARQLKVQQKSSEVNEMRNL